MNTHRHGSDVQKLSFNRDGSRLASGGRNTKVKLWDWRNGMLLATLQGHSADVSSVSWNHDGNRL
ncbi:hypothetical protein ABTN71_20305, partial [Acinetobacter baumannii]